jgi:hypothetical protein
MTGALAGEARLSTQLIVGAKALIELDDEQIDRTSVLGWRDSSFILLEWPMRKDHLAPLTVGKKCRMRFLGPTDACAFDSNVIDYRQLGIDSWCWVKWPRHFEVRPFRRHERFQVAMPCRFEGECGGTGEIIDLSIGGCALQTQQQVESGERLMLNFSLDVGTISDLEVEVKNCRQLSPATYRLGCEICFGQELAAADIAYFLAQNTGRTNYPVPTKPVVAVLNSAVKVKEDISKFFHDTGCECMQCKSAFELLSRMKLVEPVAIFVIDSPDLALEFFFLLLQQTPGLEDLPLFMLDQGGKSPLPDGIRRISKIDQTTAEIICERVSPRPHSET